jgi:hypothetical protein
LFNLPFPNSVQNPEVWTQPELDGSSPAGKKIKK